MEIFVLFYQLLIGHAVADFVLQPAPMARGKNRNNDLRAEYGQNFPSWHYWLGAHALTHAGIVFVITGSALFSLLETLSHALIDFCKCEKYYNFHLDQVLHISFKVLYCVLFYFQIS